MKAWNVMAILGGLAVSNVAWAGELDVQLRMGSQIAEDTSFDALSQNNQLTYSALQVGMGMPAVDGLRLYFNYDNSTLPSAVAVNNVALDWTRYRFMLGGEYGMAFGPLRPHLGLAGGYALQELTVDAGDSRTDFTHDVAFEGYLGTDFRTDVAQWDGGQTMFFIAGARLGYQMQTEARFDELDSEADDGWRRPDNDFGVLDVDGLFWNIGVGLGFAF